MFLLCSIFSQAESIAWMRRYSPTAYLAGFVGMNSDYHANLLKILATPAGIEPATNSLEIVRKLKVFNAHSDKTAVPAALSNKTKF
jgi:hypothetical protein